MDYQAHFNAALRLCVLQLLAGLPNYRANSSIIQSAVDAAQGFVISRDLLKTHLAWLGEQGFVKTEDLEKLVIATLTARGLEVAQGIATVPGVAKPEPL